MDRTAAILALLLAVPAPGRDLKALYLERCAPCHGADASGRGAGGVRLGGGPLLGRGKGEAHPVEALVTTLLGGKGAMPGFRHQLSEAEARRLITEVIPALGPRRKSAPPPR